MPARFQRGRSPVLLSGRDLEMNTVRLFRSFLPLSERRSRSIVRFRAGALSLFFFARLFEQRSTEIHGRPVIVRCRGFDSVCKEKGYTENRKWAGCSLRARFVTWILHRVIRVIIDLFAVKIYQYTKMLFAQLYKSFEIS